MENTRTYQQAKERAEAKYGFRVHFTTYLLVSVLLIIINVANASGITWAVWPIMGWGIGVFFHAFGVYFLGNRRGVTEKMIQKELSKDRGAW